MKARAAWLGPFSDISAQQVRRGGCAAGGRAVLPRVEYAEATLVRDWPALRRYAIGGALFAAGYVDFALIAFHFERDHVMGVPAISVSFAVAMAAGALAA